MSESGEQDLVISPIDAPEWQHWSLQIAQIVARAWVDEAFKEDFINHPAEMLREHGLAVPESMEVVVKEGATSWSMSGSGFATITRFEIPLPPKPNADDLLAAWAEGQSGHPPILGAGGQVAFEGMSDVPLSDDVGLATARRITARRIAARRISLDSYDDGVEASPIAARRVTARRIALRRVTARRVQEPSAEEGGSDTSESKPKRGPKKKT